MNVGTDSFISHKPMLSNLHHIREAGLEAFLAEQWERQLMVEQLLAHYDQGRSRTFYCTACALMPPELIGHALDEMATGPSAGETDGSDIKLRAKAMRGIIQRLAAQAGIDLKLRRKEKPA